MSKFLFRHDCDFFEKRCFNQKKIFHGNGLFDTFLALRFGKIER